MLVHTVFESLAAIDEDYRHFVGELPAKIVVRVDIHFSPRETTAPVKLADRLLDDLAEVAALPRIYDDLTKTGH